MTADIVTPAEGNTRPSEAMKPVLNVGRLEQVEPVAQPAEGKVLPVSDIFTRRKLFVLLARHDSSLVTEFGTQPRGVTDVDSTDTRSREQ